MSALGHKYSSIIIQIKIRLLVACLPPCVSVIFCFKKLMYLMMDAYGIVHLSVVVEHGYIYECGL